MKNIDYKLAMLEVISMVRDKSTYLKTIDAGNKTLYNPEMYKGMALAYHFVMDGIKTYIEYNEDLSLNDFGLEDYDPTEILNYQPLNHDK